MSSLIAWAATGFLAGLLARWIVKDDRSGCVYTMVIGILGALIGYAIWGMITGDGFMGGDTGGFDVIRWLISIAAAAILVVAYISITGRLKEIINRGGEKVSPREVDEILMDHAAVAQVVCFGMPHPKLGEEVAAAVVLREGQSVTERELQDFVGQRAADFKVPKKILFMEEIPKGATGKLQRIGLAAKLGLVSRKQHELDPEEPRSPRAH